MLDRTN